MATRNRRQCSPWHLQQLHPALSKVAQDEGQSRHPTHRSEYDALYVAWWWLFNVERTEHLQAVATTISCSLSISCRGRVAWATRSGLFDCTSCTHEFRSRCTGLAGRGAQACWPSISSSVWQCCQNEIQECSKISYPQAQLRHYLKALSASGSSWGAFHHHHTPVLCQCCSTHGQCLPHHSSGRACKVSLRVDAETLNIFE